MEGKIFLLMFFTYFVTNVTSEKCIYGCYCYPYYLDCGGVGFHTLPWFPQELELTTEVLDLSLNPDLGLTGVKLTDVFPGLIQVDLSGKIIFGYISIT